MASSDWPHTHTQHQDKTGEEDLCRIDQHHYVDDEMGGVVCTRCGDCGEEPEWFRD